MNKIVIADTSSLIGMTVAGILHLLNHLFPEVIIIPVVEREFGEELPSWIRIENFQNAAVFNHLCERLDEGEASASTLAREMPDAIL